MKITSRLYSPMLAAVAICAIVSGCGASPKPVAGPPESSPAAISTSEPTIAPTSLPTPTADPSGGWKACKAGSFQISLPEQWEAVDVAKDGVNAILSKIQGLDDQWAQSVSSMISTEGIRNMMQFWAMDPSKAGAGYATANIVYQAMPSSATIGDICAQVQSTYEKMGITVANIKKDFTVNGLDSAQIDLKMSSGSITTREYQYYYLQGGSSWLLTLAADDAQWETYEPVFEKIAESFKAEAVN